MIDYKDFAKLEIKIGKILSAEKIEGADKLLKLQVDFGFKETVPQHEIVAQPLAIEQMPDIRQIVSGIAEFYTPESLIGKEAPFVVNLEPRVLRGVESFGMIMAASDNGRPVILIPETEVAPGTIVK
jgi:tRNA-binding EMAP/Myf-like protein